MGKFTDRFIRVPIRVFDKTAESMGVKGEDKDSYMLINPFNIICYRPSSDPTDESHTTIIYDSSGGNTAVYMPLKEFESYLNKWFDKK